MKSHPLVIAVAACALATGCMSFSSTTRAVPAPAPAAATVVVPSQSVQQTNYKDSYTGKPLSSETVTTTRY
jgi:hypothetical protein